MSTCLPPVCSNDGLPLSRALGRWVWPAGLLLATFARGTLAQDSLFVVKLENELKYVQGAVHGPLIGALDTHSVTPPAVDWDTPITVTGAGNSVSARIVAQHLVAPHPELGELAPGPVWPSPVLALWAPPVGQGVLSAAGKADRDHVHIDHFQHRLEVCYVPAAQVNGYVYSSVGVHDPVSCATRSGGLSKAQVVPQSPSDAFGSAAMCIDMSNYTFGLAVTVRGIQPADVLAGRICEGAQGTNGPVIFDLGPPGAWVDMEGLGIGRFIIEETFPAAYVAALLAGNTYIEVCTLAYPAGEIRAQLVDEQSVLVDTGAPHQVLYNGNPSYLGYSSGNLAGMPQRWAAVPFSIPSGGANITRIDADWFVSPGYEAETINYIIWQRSGQTLPPLPGDERAMGVLGPYQAGLDDPRTPDMNDWLHIYDGLDIWLPAGDYYFTLYAAGIGPGNTTGFSDSPWLTGGDLQEEDLEQPFMWRSASFPTPGFQPYDNPAIQPAPGQDPDDRWNPSFAIYGLANSMMGTPGDVNCDGSVNFGDINPFVLYLSNFAVWLTTYPDCPPENGDINGDGVYPSFGDINPFVALLTGL
jgi:hypothetical protein